MKKLSLSVIFSLLITFSVIGCSQINGSALQNIKTSTLDKNDKTLTIQLGNDNGGSGTVDPDYGNHSYKSRDNVIVTATPQPGSLFAGWQGDLDGILSTMSAIDPSKPSSWLDYKINVLMDRDVTLTPLFFLEYNLNINVNGPGIVRILKVQGLGDLDGSMFTGDITQNSSGSHIYSDGEYTTFTIIPNSNSTFTGWTWTGDMNQIDPKYLPIPKGQPVDGSMMIPLDPLSTNVTVYMNHDVKLTANFASK